jgi:putative ABC transport system substrate-binding protein
VPPSGFVASLSRPGGNVTGFTILEGSVAGKWLELLKEIAPRVARVAFLFNPKNGALCRILSEVFQDGSRVFRSGGNRRSGA